MQHKMYVHVGKLEKQETSAGKLMWLLTCWRYQFMQDLTGLKNIRFHKENTGQVIQRTEKDAVADKKNAV